MDTHIGNISLLGRIGQNTYLYSGVHKKHPHGNTRCHPERSEGSHR